MKHIEKIIQDIDKLNYLINNTEWDSSTKEGRLISKINEDLTKSLKELEEYKNNINEKNSVTIYSKDSCMDFVYDNLNKIKIISEDKNLLYEDIIKENDRVLYHLDKLGVLNSGGWDPITIAPDDLNLCTNQLQWTDLLLQKYHNRLKDELINKFKIVNNFDNNSKLSAYNMKLKDYLIKHNISTSKFDDDAEVGYFIPYKYLFNNPKKYAVFMFICDNYLDGKTFTGKKIFNELGFNYKYSSSILKDLQEKDFIVRVPVIDGIKNKPSEYGMKIYKDITNNE